jgi:dihydrolipoamide dehydrogenase
MSKQYDLTVIGAGSGGYVAAIRAAQKGLRTAVIEMRDVGGTCLNRGCIPTKSMLHSAHVYRQAKESELFGVLAGDVSFDFGKICERRDDVVMKLRTGTERLLAANGVDIIRGTASINDANTVTVDCGNAAVNGGATLNGSTAKSANNAAANDSGNVSGRFLELQTKHIIIATGSKPNRLPPRLMDIDGVITSDEALTPGSEFHKRVLILGGGVIGVEFAGMYNDLGCDVTVVDSLPDLISRTDIEISKNLTKLFAKRGIKVLTPAALTSIEKTGDGLRCVVTHKHAEKDITADRVLVCVGRSPVTDWLRLQKANAVNIELDERGFIVTDEHLRTSIPNIYAIGDCVKGSVQLAHAASAQGLNAVSRIVGESRAVNTNAIPACVYTNPEIATVGLTDKEAEAAGYSVKVGKYIMSGNGKSIITDEDRGFIKLVFDASNDVLIGAHLMCARATDIIGEAANAVANKQTAEQLASIIRPHPTYMEGMTEAVESVFGMAVHVIKGKG